MKPDEMRKHIKEIKGLGQFPIKNHDHLNQMLGGKDKEFKFKDKKMTMEDVMRMFPANYFPIESEDDLTDKAVKLTEIGKNGFQPATGKRPDKEGPPELPREQQENLKEHDCDGAKKK
jgi:hypothetical protein